MPTKEDLEKELFEFREGLFKVIVEDLDDMTRVVKQYALDGFTFDEYLQSTLPKYGRELKTINETLPKIVNQLILVNERLFNIFEAVSKGDSYIKQRLDKPQTSNKRSKSDQTPVEKETKPETKPKVGGFVDLSDL